jgi:hypothetical protein
MNVDSMVVLFLKDNKGIHGGYKGAAHQYLLLRYFVRSLTTLRRPASKKL